MQVKRYEVATIREASALIRRDLGPEAVILSTKRIDGGKGARIEVVAGRDEASLPAAAGQQPAGGEEMANPACEPAGIGDLTR